MSAHGSALSPPFASSHSSLALLAPAGRIYRQEVACPQPRVPTPWTRVSAFALCSAMGSNRVARITPHWLMSVGAMRESNVRVDLDAFCTLRGRFYSLIGAVSRCKVVGCEGQVIFMASPGQERRSRHCSTRARRGPIQLARASTKGRRSRLSAWHSMYRQVFYEWVAIRELLGVELEMAAVFTQRGDP